LISLQALQQLELLAQERMKRAAKSDPVAFAKLTHLDPDPWQADVLRSKSRRMLLNCCRQSGKSTTLSTLALHTAIYQPKSLTLVICPALRQSSELVRKVMERVSWLTLKPKLEGESKLTIELSNGSRIVSLPATEATVRTFTADLIIEDEAGDVPDELYQAILPMLVVRQGRLILSGTPKGRRGHFFEAWERRASTWQRFEIPATQCPRITPGELAAQREDLRDRFPQEYECQFINASSGMVYGSFDELRNCIDELPKLVTKEPWTYMLGVDFGFDDACAFTILGYREQDPTAYVVASFKQKGMSPNDVGQRVSELETTFHFTRIIGDEGGMGKGYAEELRRRFHIPVEAAQKPNKRGYIDLLNGDLKASKIKILRPANEELLKEITTLPWNEDRTKEHPGFENHLTDSLLYIWRACTTYLTKPQDNKPKTPEEVIHKFVDDFWERDKQQRQVKDQDEEDIFGPAIDPNDAGL
jgi:hypothetical protein